MQAAALVPMAISGGLSDRLLGAVGVFAIYWLLTFIPIPGLDHAGLAALYLPGSGGADLPRVSIVMLGLGPMLSVLVVYEFVKILWPSIASWRAAAPENAARLDVAVAAFALLLAFFQGIGLAAAFENLNYAIEPGWSFRLSFAASLVVGTALLIALTHQASRWGIVDGFWLVYAAPILGGLAGSLYWAAAAGELQLASPPLLATAGLAVATLVLLLFCIKTSPQLVEPGALAWPVYLAIYAIAVSLIPAIKLLPEDVSNGLVAAVSFGEVWRNALLLLLIPAFVILRQLAGGTSREDARRLAPAAIAVAILVIAGEWLNVNVGAAFKIDVPTLLAIAAAVLAVLKLRLPA